MLAFIIPNKIDGKWTSWIITRVAGEDGEIITDNHYKRKAFISWGIKRYC